MLKNIKSIYCFKNIVTIISEKRKLDLVKYNKKMQKTLDINLFDYRLLSKKYIIYEQNGKVKEYDNFNDKLIYEGEYSNKQKNGQGKEYYENGNIKFEGEYLNGKKWNGKLYHYSRRNKENIQELKEGKGYIKEFYSNDNIKYEGEYYNGQRNGKGKEYNYDGFLAFEGEYLDNKKYNVIGYDSKKNIIYKIEKGKGFIKEYDDEKKLIYEGEYLNGEKNGKGKVYNLDGQLIFEGEYLNNQRKKGKELIFVSYVSYEGEYLYGNKWNGKGYDKNHSIKYEIINGKGNIKEYLDNGELIYEGEYLNGERNGKGNEYYHGHIIYVGEYLNGKRHGKGKEYFCNDLIERIGFFGDFEESFERKMFIRRKKNKNNDKKVFEGEYLNGQRWNGKGKEFDNHGEVKYEGEYLNGKRWNGILFEYIYENDKKGVIEYFEQEITNGIEKRRKFKKKIFDSDGVLYFDGEFSNGKRNGFGKEYFKCGSLKSEGEYFDDFLNGEVKEYHFNGQLKFVGKYLKGKRTGYGKEYDFFGKLIFDGKY